MQPNYELFSDRFGWMHTENENTLQQALDAQQGKWTTVVNWDSRRPIEMGGRKGLEPHQLRWLQRMKPYDYE